ncbi:MAG: tetratricopeptide repeat protein [Candidatus Aminicenantes bacterium]|nr:tetratricopeptide repeat protein [Candidatus Aminicenantes bacterium]
MAKDQRLAFLKQANKLFRQGKIDAAVKEYTKVLDIKPDDLEVRRIVGDLELRQNNLNNAVKQFEWIADYYLREGFFAKAIAMYKRVNRIDPNYERASFKLGELYTKQGLLIEAKQVYLDLAEEYKQKQNQKKALDMYKKILEFDRSNIKMRLLLADNYLKERLKEDAVNEYIVASDILLNKKDYRQAAELLKNTLAKVKDLKLFQKLIRCYTLQGEEDQAIELLKNLGGELYQNVELMKILGELLLKKNRTGEAEKVFARVAQIAPGESIIVMKLGEDYLRKEEYDRTYQLFLPIVDKNLQDSKFEEAASLMRLIITSKHDYLPALNKLAVIYEKSGKTGNLTALYESLIPIYEQNGMRDALKINLERLIKLSEHPITFQEKLAKLKQEETQEKVEKDEQEADARISEYVKKRIQLADEALRVSNYKKAIDILKETKLKVPQTIDVRKKLFDIYYKLDEVDLAVEEGKELLSLYQARNLEYEYSELLDKLSSLNADDEALIEMSGEERTNIDIDFGTGEFHEQMEEIKREQIQAPGSPGKSKQDTDEDVLLLTDTDSIKPQKHEASSESAYGEDKKMQKSLSSLLSELDFYINDGYYNDAEQLAEELKSQYPGNTGLMLRLKKLESIKGAVRKPAETPLVPPAIQEEDFVKLDVPMQEYSDLDDLSFDLAAAESEERGEITTDLGMGEFIESKDKSERFIEIHEAAFIDEPSLSDEQKILHEIENYQTDSGFRLDEDTGEITSASIRPADNASFEIEMDEAVESDNVPLSEIDATLLRRSPATAADVFSEDAFDVDNVMMEGTAKRQAAGVPAQAAIRGKTPGPDIESPFQEIEQTEISDEDDDELLKSGNLLIEDEAYFTTEKNVTGELQAIISWLKELDRQRTSTIEKNMIEIFSEFKKGIDEKIGREDYDTRYNLGIAYKEMGLVEEAIHEFQISAKHPEKFFDSAGLLGMCFTEKGMLGEAVNWYEKALQTPERKAEEYLAIKYELAVTLKAKEDYQKARLVIEDIMRTHPGYRNIAYLYQEITARSQNART